MVDDASIESGSSKLPHNLEYWRYTLRSGGALNAVSQRREFHGALLRVNGVGVGCLHPWPEFGDAPVEEQLLTLAAGGRSAVIDRALRMAAVDGAARQAGVSLFHDLEIPRCHYSWDQHAPLEVQAQQMLVEGWSAVKTKGTPDTEALLRWMDQFVRLTTNEATDRPPVRVRIDFNSSLTLSAFEDFLSRLSPAARARLDFVEDPFPYDTAAWEAVSAAWGVDLALDKQLRHAQGGYAVAVLKPGRREWRETVAALPLQIRIVMTSAMDHAIGQSFAAWEAATALPLLGPRLDLCGLCTGHLFEPDDFFPKLHAYGGLLSVDRQGTGLGFDEILAGLPWEPVA